MEEEEKDLERFGRLRSNSKIHANGDKDSLYGKRQADNLLARTAGPLEAKERVFLGLPSRAGAVRTDRVQA